MKILDETGAVVENPDLTLGYLTDDTQPLEHPAQEAVAAAGAQILIDTGEIKDGIAEDLDALQEQLGIPCQRMKIENEQEAWRDVVQWVENPAEAAAVLSRLSEENILLAGDYRNLPHYASLLRKDHLFCRIVPTVEALDLAKKVGVPETHIVAAYGPYTRAFNSAVFDMLGIDVLVIRDVALDGGLAECVIPALERQMHVMMVRGE